MNTAKAKFEEFKGKVQNAIDDPSSLAPGAGGLAACATWYGSAVAGKLGALNDESSELIATLLTVVSDVDGPMKELSANLEGAIADLDSSVKSLAKLPKTVAAAVQGKDDPKDIAEINTEPLKKAVAGGDIDGALQKIVGMKDVLAKVVEVVSTGLEKIEGFISAAPDKVRGAFDVPMPFCFLTSALMDNAPAPMKDLLAMCTALQGISLQPLLDSLVGSRDLVKGIEVDAIKEPVAKFVESAKESVDKLDKAVSGAKLLTGGVGGAIGGAIGGAVGKLFG